MSYSHKCTEFHSLIWSILQQIPRTKSTKENKPLQQVTIMTILRVLHYIHQIGFPNYTMAIMALRKNEIYKNPNYF